MIGYVWYPVEFAAYIAIIAYVLYTFGIINVAKPKNDVPATFGDTLQQTKSIIGTAAEFAQQLKGLTATTPPVQAPAPPPVKGK